MQTFFLIAGFVAGALGGFISALVLAKKFRWSMDNYDKLDDPFRSALAFSMVLGGGGGAALAYNLLDSGVCAEVCAILALPPAIVFAVVFGLIAAPRLSSFVDGLTDWLAGLTVAEPKTNKMLRQRIEELEATVLKMQSEQRCAE